MQTPPVYNPKGTAGIALWNARCERVRREGNKAAGERARQALLAVLAGWALCASQAQGQEYPTRMLRILTSAPGSGSDAVARIVADRLPATLGQRAIVDNRAILAPEIAAKSAPDGYTALFYSSPLWVSPL